MNIHILGDRGRKGRYDPALSVRIVKPTKETPGGTKHGKPYIW